MKKLTSRQKKVLELMKLGWELKEVTAGNLGVRPYLLKGNDKIPIYLSTLRGLEARSLVKRYHRTITWSSKLTKAGRKAL